MAVNEGRSSNSMIRSPYLLTVLDTTSILRDQILAILRLEDQSEEAPEDDQFHAFSDLQKYLGVYISQLRGQNRRIAHLIHETKAQTGASRAEIDRLHLSLQNLYYEQRHLQGEIAACEEYPHTYKQLPLVSEDEFLVKHPDWLQMRSSTDENGPIPSSKSAEEDLMRARIQDEHDARAVLETQKQDLFKRKLELAKENAKRKEQLVNLDKDLEAFIEAAKPIQKTFEKEY